VNQIKEMAIACSDKLNNAILLVVKLTKISSPDVQKTNKSFSIILNLRPMDTIYHISVWLHIIGVSFWIGGMLFLPMVLLPAIKGHPDRRNLLMQTGLKFRFFGYIVLGLLLVTGISNMLLRGVDVSWKFLVISRYGKLVIIKLILFLSMLAVSLVHDVQARKRLSTDEERRKFKVIALWSGRILLIISLAMSFIGVVLSRGA
jgi:putative copper export protein